MKSCIKSIPLLLGCMLIICGLFSVAYAQRIVHVAPTDMGILNKVIAEDTERTPDTIYELERGPNAYYILNGTIEHEGYHLRIYAEAGEGERPKLVPAVLSGGVSSRCFAPKDDLTLKGLYVTNVDQGGAMYDKNIVRAQAEGIRIVIDDCHLDGDRQSFVRFDAHNQRVFITNSILSWSVLNGRGLDRRGNKVDTLVVENCTFYNLISKVMREGGSGYIKYFKFNHNTCVHIGEEFLEIGEVATLIFTNNLIVNPGFLGVSSTATGELPLIFVNTLKNEELAGLTQTIELRNNNFYLDPAIINAHANLNLEGYTVVQRPFADSLTLTLIDTTALIHEPIVFTKGPSLDTTLNIIKVVWEEYSGEEDYAPPFDNGGVGAFGEPGFGTCGFDFSYPTTTQSYTAADGGKPLGDLNWFGMEPVSIDEKKQEIPGKFILSQNYPNPFNPMTTIQYELPYGSEVQLIIYDVVGKEVIRLVDGNQEMGVHRVVWDGRDAIGRGVSSGVYLFRLKAG
ncbi:MAG: T9SS type A sorting domain-containing protein, partial [bacterium]